MRDTAQENHYEMLTGLALKGGGYNWNTVPISDGEPGFVISRPQSELNREAEKALRRTIELTGAEPNVTTEEHTAAAPRNPYAAPSRVMPATKGRPLDKRLFHPRTDVGPLAGLSTNQFADAALELFDAIDRRRRARDKKRQKDERSPHGDNRFPVTRKQQDDDRDDGEIEAYGQTKVANDRRSAAFDTAFVMPLEDEQLYSWHGWLPTRVPVTGAAQKHFSNLRTFLRREGLHRKKFSELSSPERVVLQELVDRLVAA